jgi:hypothetical protein
MFDAASLVEKYGSPIRVQVAFYDFLFEKALNKPVHGFALETIKSFEEGGDFYESTVKKIEELYPSLTTAWEEFISDATTEEA